MIGMARSEMKNAMTNRMARLRLHRARSYGPDFRPIDFDEDEPRWIAGVRPPVTDTDFFPVTDTDFFEVERRFESQAAHGK
jgi:hypothetical protein